MKRFIFMLSGLLVSSMVMSQIPVEVNPDVKYQEIEGFGASDAWSTEVVGATFGNEAKERAAKWLFSPSISNTGVCEGIGLSIWRFYLGPFGNMPAGSVSIPQDYLDADGAYDWTVNPGKQWFLDKALSYGCDQIGAWSSCMLPQLRTEGMTAQSYKNYAGFLADVVSHYNQLGYRFKYLAPVNEPQYDWTEGEVKWTSSCISAMAGTVCQEFLDRGLDTPIFLGEAADWGNLYDTNDTDSNWARNQIYNYFDETSPLYIGHYSNLMKEFGVHSYWTDQSASRLKEYRTKAKAKADEYNIKLHQTEWSMLSNPPIEGLPDTPSDMDYALILAKVVYSDIVFAGVNSWTYWEAFGVGDDARFHLIHTDNVDKSFEVRKNLWALGNYSLFVRPGYQRVQMTGVDDLNGVMGTAYLSPEQGKLVLVLVNMGSTAQVAPTINLSDESEIKKAERYVTSSMFDLQLMPVTNLNSIPVLAKSVTSIVYTIGSKTGLAEKSCKNTPLYVYRNNTIVFNGDKKIDRAVLYDLTGRMVAAYDAPTCIDMGDMKHGLYGMKLDYDGTTKVEKILVK